MCGADTAPRVSSQWSACVLPGRCRLSLAVPYFSSHDLEADERCSFASFKRKWFPVIHSSRRQASSLSNSDEECRALTQRCPHWLELQHGACFSHRKPGFLVCVACAVKELQGQVTPEDIRVFLFLCEEGDFARYHCPGAWGGVCHHTCQSGHSQALIRLGRKDDQTALLDLRDGRMETQNSYLRLV